MFSIVINLVHLLDYFHLQGLEAQYQMSSNKSFSSQLSELLAPKEAHAQAWGILGSNLGLVADSPNGHGKECEVLAPESVSIGSGQNTSGISR